MPPPNRLKKGDDTIEKTISFETGVGSLSHNCRTFIAENVDKERTPLNREYCNEPIKKVYHKLFDKALQEYNDKQKRKDRRIENYYEHISTGHQEKPFTEIVVQIGNMEDTHCGTEDPVIKTEENIDLIPSNIELCSVEVGLVNEMSRERVLSAYINEIKNKYD